ncbi:protein kinase PKP1 [Saccharomyces eubayanus]|uniref:protein kinase PKP1 n=1 Tax=Saccharomyces eubayanus TaxID=1080349 RepID=UPI0006C6403A|nr:PKP1-like protein [Saccharomyces eubayanus]KOG98850.1 PKP1-like protein [Saccharomyces eubayanus]
MWKVMRVWRCGGVRWAHRQRPSNELLSELSFDQHYKIRSNIGLLIQDYASKPIAPLDYEYFLQYRPPLTRKEEYMLTIKTINLLLSLTCKRLNAIQRLPYNAVINPHLERTNSLYLKSLQTLLSVAYPYELHNPPKIQAKFTELLDDHEDAIVVLAKGLQEIRTCYPQFKISQFLNFHLKERITMKLLVTHYLSLTAQNNDESDGKTIGILQRDLPIVQLVKHVSDYVNDICFVKFNTQRTPVLVYPPAQDIAFTCIPPILEYIMTEVFKNAFEAQIAHGKEHVPIEVNLLKPDDDELYIRIRDHGGGITPEVEALMFDYSYSTRSQQPSDDEDSTDLPGEQINNVSGMGFGLPMCKTYLELFGGKMDIQSLPGWGTDVYIKLKGPSKAALLAKR